MLKVKNTNTLCAFKQKDSTFADAITEVKHIKNFLGYGVMVTLQILVLSFLVRIRVSQQQEKKKQKRASRKSELSFCI